MFRYNFLEVYAVHNTVHVSFTKPVLHVELQFVLAMFKVAFSCRFLTVYEISTVRIFLLKAFLLPTQICQWLSTKFLMNRSFLSTLLIFVFGNNLFIIIYNPFFLFSSW